MNTVKFFSVLLILLALGACKESKNTKKLPIYGRKQVVTKEVNGKRVSDTLYHHIADFSFINQNGDTISKGNFKNKIYVADFFFVNCPSICPIMTKNLLKVYESTKNEKDFSILSHSIDPKDTVQVLSRYATGLEVEAPSWHFVTGPSEEIYKIAETYMVSAGKDDEEPGGYVHSGKLILVDEQKRIRGYYDGTDPASVEQVIQDARLLLYELHQNE